MNNKKAISAVVATVLIILITVAAVTIVWTAVIPMVRNIGNVGDCFDASAALSVMSDYSCYNDTEVRVQVSVGAGDFELSAIKVQIGEGGTTLSKEFNSTTIPALPGFNEEKLYTIALSELEGISAPDSVGVVAVIKSGNTNEECTASGMIPISVCA